MRLQKLEQQVLCSGILPPPTLPSSIPPQGPHPQDLLWDSWSSLVLSEPQVLQLGSEKIGIWDLK